MKRNIMQSGLKTFLRVVQLQLTLLIAATAFTQAPSMGAIPDGTTPGAAAWVYVQTTEGVDVYDAAEDGKLTLVKGSPFRLTGAPVASNGSHLITLGTDLIYSYAIESDGAIGTQDGEIDPQDYEGGKCGSLIGAQATLDHTGRNLYVQIVPIESDPVPGQNQKTPCAAVQTYDVAKGSGLLSFVGATVDTRFPADALDDGDCCTQLTLTGNDDLAYAVTEPGTFWNGSLFAYRRQSDGALRQIEFNEIDPSAQPGGGFPYAAPVAVAADPAGHLAALTWGEVDGQGEWQLASYTVDEEGNVVSTNDWENMPKVTPVVLDTGSEYSSVLSISPSGKLLAVQTQAPWGFQLFRFNGAGPITSYSSILLPKVSVWQMSWDSSNHLYIVGPDNSPYGSAPSEPKLYVFTVTPNAIAEVTGSPFPVKNGAYSVLVVSR
jgi:hypothetical protein